MKRWFMDLWAQRHGMVYEYDIASGTAVWRNSAGDYRSESRLNPTDFYQADEILSPPWLNQFLSLPEGL